MSKRRFLYMSHIEPYPVQGGERLRVAGLLRLLSELGEVEAIIQTGAGTLPTPEEFPGVRFHPFDFLRHMRPVVRYFFWNSALQAHLTQVLAQAPVDLAILDYQFYGHYIEFFQRLQIPVIYGTHNAEAELTRQEITRWQGWKRLEKWLLFHLQQTHERLYFPKAEGLMVVSAQDAQYYQRWVEPSKIVIIPNFLDPALYQAPLAIEEKFSPRQLVMTANFTVFQNQEGVRWWLHEVWQAQHLAQEFELWLIGRGSKELLEVLGRELGPLSGIQATGPVASIAPWMQGACAALVPILHGSGTRLKILEAMWYHVPVVSTPLGAQGLEGQAGVHYWLADHPEAWSRALRSLQAWPVRAQMIEKASRLLEEKYLLAANRERFRQFIEPKFKSKPHESS